MPRNTVVRYLTFPRPGWQQRGRKGGREGEGREDGILMAPTVVSHSWSPVLQSSTISLPLCLPFSQHCSAWLQGKGSQSCFPSMDHIVVQKSVLWTIPQPTFNLNSDSPLPTGALQGPPHPHPRCDWMSHHSCQDKMDHPSISWPSSHGLCSTHSNCLSEKKKIVRKRNVFNLI